MFTFIDAKSTFDGSDYAIQISWKWEGYISGGRYPSATVFHIGVPISKLLENDCCQKNDIMAYFNDKIIDLNHDNTPDKIMAINNYCSKNYLFGHTTSYQLGPGGFIRQTVTIKISKNDQDKVFLICLYDSEHFEKHIVPITTTQQIEFKLSLEQERKLLGLVRGKKYYKLKINKNDSMTKVLKYTNGGSISYSIIPGNQEEYFFEYDEGQEIDEENMEIVYMSSLIK